MRFRQFRDARALVQARGVYWLIENTKFWQALIQDKYALRQHAHYLPAAKQASTEKHPCEACFVFFG